MKQRGQKDIIQHTCGFPEPTLPQEGNTIKVINGGIDYFWRNRNMRTPSEQFNHYDEDQKESEPELEAI